MTHNIYRKIASMGGWLGFVDYCMFKNIIELQNSLGNDNDLCEIGVHHGKSFIPMVLFSGSSICHCVDVFENQSLNIDSSGKGDYNIFMRNMQKTNVPQGRVRIHKKYSTHITPEEICTDGKTIRFFHIDGGHHYEVVKSDVRLALMCSDESSVIVIDDACRPEWIEVSQAIFGMSSTLEDLKFVIFAFGFNKLYLCHESKRNEYQKSLYKDDDLRAFIKKKYEVKGVTDMPMPIYSSFPAPSWSIRSLAVHCIKLKFPLFYLKCMRPLDDLAKTLKRVAMKNTSL